MPRFHVMLGSANQLPEVGSYLLYSGLVIGQCKKADKRISQNIKLLIQK